MSNSKTNTKGVSLALGGGGVRACIYIGLYEVLRKNDIPVVSVAGTSMGAIVGACISLGYTPEMMKDFIMKLKDMNLASLQNFNFFDESLLKREKITSVLDILFGNKTFDDLEVPFACTAVDLEEKSEVILREGSIARAVEASSAYPLLFPPLFYKSRYLIDGGILKNVPASLARSMSSAPLIAIKIKNNFVRQYISGQIYKKHYGKSDKGKIWGALSRKKQDIKFLIDIVLDAISIASDANVKKDIEESKPDILLEPTIDVGLLDFSKVDEIIEEGKRLGKEALPKIKELINDMQG